MFFSYVDTLHASVSRTRTRSTESLPPITRWHPNEYTIFHPTDPKKERPTTATVSYTLVGGVALAAISASAVRVLSSRPASPHNVLGYNIQYSTSHPARRPAPSRITNHQSPVEPTISLRWLWSGMPNAGYPAVAVVGVAQDGVPDHSHRVRLASCAPASMPSAIAPIGVSHRLRGRLMTLLIMHALWYVAPTVRRCDDAPSHIWSARPQPPR